MFIALAVTELQLAIQSVRYLSLQSQTEDVMKSMDLYVIYVELVCV